MTTYRHTPRQVEELEAFFVKCDHPSVKERQELSEKLDLEMHQVKFWFQNRRNQMKVQLGRQNNCFLREENVRLRAENELLWETMKKPLCKDCGNPSMEGQRLRAENIRLKEEINRFCSSINGTGF
ncbi:hypothetical protein ZOSMA_138G00110 [Zostera marina]|uniref:Homeobox domain-containing protein n=1 Tax=Zostera marina TaxID=29655 RepID=A0A0K9PYG1_ZOSMR|nr:hypothetical protein ZOSMA_138G00110 [Zostera marina]